ncbi:hypothetical protein Ga0074812_12425 [Parafrankia irregularis]|uniref:Uncharacterized protein n=1 Tax=Parafrankia irregularis TaxID=795642 RepID=A0A0S4QW28_9ACTN|nr:hypothetical protein Ga0074812_12425 [Parafrankia irregularis]
MRRTKANAGRVLPNRGRPHSYRHHHDDGRSPNGFARSVSYTRRSSPFRPPRRGDTELIPTRSCKRNGRPNQCTCRTGRSDRHARYRRPRLSQPTAVIRVRKRAPSREGRDQCSSSPWANRMNSTRRIDPRARWPLGGSRTTSPPDVPFIDTFQRCCGLVSVPRRAQVTRRSRKRKKPRRAEQLLTYGGNVGFARVSPGRISTLRPPDVRRDRTKVPTLWDQRHGGVILCNWTPCQGLVEPSSRPARAFGLAPRGLGLRPPRKRSRRDPRRRRASCWADRSPGPR